MRKYVTQFVALERNAEKGIPGHMAEAYDAYRAGRLEDFYAPLVVDDVELERGLASGTLDDRHAPARRLAALGFGDASAGARRPERGFGRLDPVAAAALSRPSHGARGVGPRRSRSARGSTGSSAASACSSEALSRASAARCTGRRS